MFIFVLLLPTQLGRHFFLSFSYLSGLRVDYLAPTVYLIDIVAIALAFLNLKLIIGFIRKKSILILLFVLLVNVLFSIVPIISMYRYIRIVESLIILAIFSKYKDRKLIGLGFLMTTTIEVFLMVVQFITKRSLGGFFYFLGERYFTLSTPSIAKGSLNGTEILRPYGTFSHPNSMAGFYLVVYFFFLTNKKFRYPYLKNLLLFLSTLLIFFSFSRVAIIVYIFLNLAYFFNRGLKNVCRICVISKLLMITVVGAMFIQIKGDVSTLTKRLSLTGNALKILWERPIFGTGLNTYLIAQNNFSSKFYGLINQPVHNIFLFFLCEVGVLLSVIIFFVFFEKIKKFFLIAPYVFLAIFITGMFDHYWLTLPQNWFLLSFIISQVLY